MEEYIKCLDAIALTNHIDDDLVESQWGSEDETNIQNQLKLEKEKEESANQGLCTNIADIIPPLSQDITQAESNTNVDNQIHEVQEEQKEGSPENDIELKISNGPSPISVTNIEGEHPSPGLPEHTGDLAMHNLT